MADTPNMVRLTVDDVTFDVPAGMNLVDACKRYAGVDVPVFCYHPKLGHDGNCRMCLVELATPRKNNQTGEMELAWFPTLQTACTQYVSDGMTIRTLSKVVQDGRREILEFLLSSHPLDCPICDKGGECPLQNLTMRHGPGTSRMYWDEKMRLGKHVPLGEIIYLDQERCIQCQRCIRFQDNIAGDSVLGFDDRGRATRIVTNSTPGFDSIFSGNTTDICPVGALTTADFRFNARPWEMVPVATVCEHCPVGCNMTFDTRTDRDTDGRTVIKRVMPRQNEAVNEIWICDKGRFAHHHMDDQQRLTTPLIRKSGKLVEATWDEAFEAIAQNLRDASHEIAALAGGSLSNEDYYMLQKLVRGRGSSSLSVFPDTAPGGEFAVKYGVGAGTDLQQLGKGDAIIVVASDLHEEAPVWYLRVMAAARRGATLIVLNGRETKLDKYATHRLGYAYGDELGALDKLTDTPLIKKAAQMAAKVVAAVLPGIEYEPSSFETARDALRDANNVVIFVGSEGMGPMEADRLAQTAGNVLADRGKLGQPNNGLIIVWPYANGQGASDMGFRPDLKAGYQAVDHVGRGYGDMLKALESGELKLLYIAGANPVFEDAAAEHAIRETKATVIVSDLFLTETAQLADIVLPAQSTGERDGTFTNGERRVQRFYPAIEPLGNSLPDWQIAGRIMERLGQGKSPVSAAVIMTEITQTVAQYAGITYPKLAEVVEQWPDVGGDDLYYGGTAFQNYRGIGVQYPTSAETAPDTVKAEDVEEQRAERGEGTLVIPVTCVYDREPEFYLGAPTLRDRIPAPYVALNPADAEALGVMDGDLVSVTFDNRTVEVTAHVTGGMQQGVAILGRRLQPQGAPLTATLGRIAKLERVGA